MLPFTVIQRSNYYPFGMSFGEESGEEQGKQNFKYNGKELDKEHGLNQYDYAARFMDPGMIRFTTVDPHAENYYSWSPYAYVGNNPMRLVDSDGKDWREAYNNFKGAFSASISLGMQAGLVVKMNNKGVEAKANLISLNFGGVTEGKASLNVATPDRTQEFSVDVGNLGVSFDKKIETKKDNTLEPTTTLSGSALVFKGSVQTTETFKEERNGMQTKIGETVKSENIEVKTSKDLKTVFGGSALLGVEAEVNWSKVAQELSEIIKSVKDLWKNSVLKSV